MTFFNIFSSTSVKTKPENKIKITVDNREKNSLVASELIALGFQIEFEQLPIADYLIDDIAIERKTIQDLKQSIINKRIFSQLEEIKQYPNYLLIVEGTSSEKNLYEGIIHENALRGFLLSATLSHKVPIIFTQNEKDTAIYISLLAKKSPNRELSLRPSKIAFTEEEQIQFILEGFPNIGPVTAKALIKKFSTLKNIINSSESELEEILGKKAKDFKKLIDHQV